jgi:hypothetical protein
MTGDLWVEMGGDLFSDVFSEDDHVSLLFAYPGTRATLLSIGIEDLLDLVVAHPNWAAVYDTLFPARSDLRKGVTIHGKGRKRIPWTRLLHK